MRTFGHSILPMASVLLFAISCGTEKESHVSRIGQDTLVAPDTLVTTASGLIGSPSDLALSRDGHLLLADRGFNRILVIPKDRSEPTFWGTEGDGPGEFRQPWALTVSSDTLFVYDMRKRAVLVFRWPHEFIRAYPVSVPQIARGRGMTPHGELIVATNGQDSVLAVVVDSAGLPVRGFGKPVAPPGAFLNFPEMKRQYSEGKVPSEHLNDVLPAVSIDGVLFLAFYATPEVRAYGPDGSLLWTRRFEEPIFDRNLRVVAQRNRENPDPSRMSALWLFFDAQVIDGDLWLLLNTAEEEDGVIFVLDGNDGRLKRRVTLQGVPGARVFVFDQQTGTLFLAVSEDSMLLAYDLDR